ncbi:MAG: DUF1194 domain-containing protein [Octadecabacter sp.]
MPSHHPMNTRPHIRAAALLSCVISGFGASAQACETALLLTIDVSNSIDVTEYRLPTDGMADAMLDAEIADALIDGQVAAAVIQ